MEILAVIYAWCLGIVALVKIMVGCLVACIGTVVGVVWMVSRH